MNIKRQLTAIGLMCSLMILISGVRSPTTVFADTINHTHIWATTYDSTNHWEYCTVCGEKKNVTAHTFADHWYSHSGVCGGKASNRTCDCGYGYTYYPQHVQDSTVHSATSSVRVHYWTCKNCGAWVSCEACRNEKGYLSCKNPGTCSVCRGVWPVGRHYIFGGRCIDCGKQIYTITNNTQTYNADFSKVIYSFDVVPQTDNVEVVSSTCYCSGTSNCKRLDRNFKKNDDGSYTITWIMTLDPTKATNKMTPCWRYDNVTVDGYTCYVQEECFHEFWMDHTVPIVSDIKQTDQKSYNGYATIKQLDISGTEDYANQITLSISDKATGKVMVDKAKIPVTDNKWSYTCTPPLEADENGRTYVVRTEDVNGNVSTKEFTIFKTDGTAPQVESPLSYTNWTAKAKTITFTISDYGSGSPQASLGDQTHYKACTKVGDKYQITYIFNDDIVGTKNYDLYLKDALGNARKVTLTVGNIDKKTYTITYNLNGSNSGTALKTTYTVEDLFTLPQPTKTGYTFTGWTGSNGTTPQNTVTVNKGTRGNLSYTANWRANNYYITFNGNGGSLNVMDGSITKNDNGTATAKVQYDLNYYYSLGILAVKPGFTFKGFYDAPSGGTQVFRVDGTTRCLSVPSKYYNENDSWKYPENVTFYAQYTPITWTMKYDGNGATSGSMLNTKHTYKGGVHITSNKFTKIGWSFNGWYATRVRNGKTEFLCGTTSNGFIDGSKWYEKDKIPSDMAIYKWRDNETAHICTYIDNDVITLHAQWKYNPVSVKIPQVIIGNEKGTSQFRVSCDSIKSGIIAVSVSKTFTYTQSGKTSVTATINNKSGGNIITPSNKICVYNITTPNGLSAGCWQGNFNIGLTLTKE